MLYKYRISEVRSKYQEGWITLNPIVHLYEGHVTIVTVVGEDTHTQLHIKPMKHSDSVIGHMFATHLSVEGRGKLWVNYSCHGCRDYYTFCEFSATQDAIQIPDKVGNKDYYLPVEFVYHNQEEVKVLEAKRLAAPPPVPSVREAALKSISERLEKIEDRMLDILERAKLIDALVKAKCPAKSETVASADPKGT
jgi:hypothetical protein